MDFDKVLHEEIEDEFKSLRGIEVGSPEYKIGVDGVAKLMEKSIEIEKFNVEYEERLKTQEEAKKAAEFERQLKLKQMEEDKKDRLIRHIIAGAGIVLPLIAFGWGTVKSLRFEEEGTYTGAISRGIASKALSWLKIV